jgi:hypothetical protein
MSCCCPRVTPKRRTRHHRCSGQPLHLAGERDVHRCAGAMPAFIEVVGSGTGASEACEHVDGTPASSNNPYHRQPCVGSMSRRRDGILLTLHRRRLTTMGLLLSYCTYFGGKAPSLTSTPRSPFSNWGRDEHDRWACIASDRSSLEFYFSL